MNNYVVRKRTGYKRPIWQVIARATGGVVTTHATHSAAVKAARVMNGEDPVGVERTGPSSPAIIGGSMIVALLGLLGRKMYGSLNDDLRERP
jgi:hypothetical protein